MLDGPNLAPCPICRGVAGDQIASYEAEEAAQAFVPRRLEPERHEAVFRKISALWHGAPCVLRKCDHCDLIYADPFVAGDIEFYRLAFSDTSYPKQKWEYDRTRRAFGEHNLLQTHLLEVGAGTGAFLRQMVEDGCLPANLHAFEFSVQGRAAIAHLGIKCLSEDLRTVALDHTFDVVCMFQVLEHLDDYERLFETLERVLRPDGHLFIAIPNGDWISLNEMRQLLLDMPPNHLSRWSLNSLAALACRFGWHLEQCELEPPSRIQTTVRVLSDRYVRLVGDESFWESRGAELAVRMGNPLLARLIKASSALLSPACVSAAIRASLVPATPQNIWAHLIRPG